MGDEERKFKNNVAETYVKDLPIGVNHLLIKRQNKSISRRFIIA